MDPWLLNKDFKGGDAMPGKKDAGYTHNEIKRWKLAFSPLRKGSTNVKGGKLGWLLPVEG